MSEQERKMLNALIGAIEEGTIAADPPPGVFTAYNDYDGKDYFIPWNHASIKRLFECIEAKAKETYKNADFYENKRIKELEIELVKYIKVEEQKEEEIQQLVGALREIGEETLVGPICSDPSEPTIGAEKARETLKKLGYWDE